MRLDEDLVGYVAIRQRRAELAFRIYRGMKIRYVNRRNKVHFLAIIFDICFPDFTTLYDRLYKVKFYSNCTLKFERNNTSKNIGEISRERVYLAMLFLKSKDLPSTFRLYHTACVLSQSTTKPDLTVKGCFPVIRFSHVRTRT